MQIPGVVRVVCLGAHEVLSDWRCFLLVGGAHSLAGCGTVRILAGKTFAGTWSDALSWQEAAGADQPVRPGIRGQRRLGFTCLSEHLVLGS